MRSPEQLRARLKTAWNRNRSDWLAGGGNWPLRLPIQPPRETDAFGNWPLFDAWLGSWREVPHGRVDTACRQWPRLGEQHLPDYWCFDSPAAVAAALGEAARWERAAQRHQAWCRRFGGREKPGWPQALARSFDVLADADVPGFEQLGNALEWLLANPASGLYPRQLPIEGIDSKWLASWQRLLAGWLLALGREADATDFTTIAGLRRPPERVRLRLLDPALAAQLGGLADITAPVEEIATLPLRPTRVLVVENRDTGLALEPLPGTVAFMALGYRVDLIARIPWITGVPLAYWGDIDSHGLAILDRLRSHHPHAESLLMDAPTLLAFRHLCAREDKPARIEPRHLTPAEADLYRALLEHRHGVSLRLEQERIPWPHAWQRIRHWAQGAASGLPQPLHTT